MKILFVAPSNSIHTYRWIKYFSNIAETFLISDIKSDFDYSFTKTFFIDSINKYNNFKEYFLSAKEIIKSIYFQIKPDIIHVHFLGGIGFIPGLLNLHPLIIRICGSDILQNLHTEGLNIMCNTSLKRSNLVISSSYYLLEIAKQKGAFKTELISPGIEKDLFFNINDKKELGLSKSKLKLKYNLPDNSFVLLSIRGMKNIYNIHKVILAFFELKKKYHNTYLIILNYNIDEYYEFYIKELISNLYLNENILILPKIQREKLFELYNISDLVISIPLSDNLPISILEAMACKVPVISSNLPSYKDILSDNENVFMVEPENEFKLEVKLEQIYLNYKEITESIISNSQLLVNKFNQEKQMKKMFEIYKSFLKF